MLKLHDPETGFKGFRNDLIASGLAKDSDEYNTAVQAKMDEMAKRYKVAKDAPDHVKYFNFTGAEIVTNRFFMSCGNAAKAFCYLNSQLPPEKRLDIQILISTDPEHLLTGMSGHTLPCVFFGGRYHAIDPQMLPTEKYILDDEIKVGNDINHILPAIAKKKRPYKILHLMTPEFYEKNLSDFNVALQYFIDCPEDAKFLLGQIRTIYKKIPNRDSKSNTRLIYDFCRNIPSVKMPVDVIRVRDDDNIERFCLRVRVPGMSPYVVHLNTGTSDIVIEAEESFISKGTARRIIEEMKPSYYTTWYEAQIIQSQSRGRK